MLQTIKHVHFGNSCRFPKSGWGRCFPKNDVPQNQDWTGRIGWDRMRRNGTGRDGMGWDRTGRDGMGQDRTGQDGTGQEA